ncbi:MAG: hypothetical protein ABII06_15650 [Pseudomonadota bacterium]
MLVETPVKALLCDIGVMDCRENYEILKTVILIAEANEVETATVNRILWLIGSGEIGDEGQKAPDCRNAFIDRITLILKPLIRT